MKNYDKPRIPSTVVISVFVTIALFLTILILPISWADVQAAVDNTAENSENAAGAVVGGFAVALVMAIGMALVIIVSIANIITTGILLPFALNNRKSTLKPVRIMSYVLDGLVGAVLITNIVKLILVIAGV